MRYGPARARSMESAPSPFHWTIHFLATYWTIKNDSPILYCPFPNSISREPNGGGGTIHFLEGPIAFFDRRCPHHFFCFSIESASSFAEIANDLCRRLHYPVFFYNGISRPSISREAKENTAVHDGVTKSSSRTTWSRDLIWRRGTRPMKDAQLEKVLGGPRI